MAAQQGFQYEKNVSDRLKKAGLVESGFQPVGAAHGRADLELFWKKDTINVELKIEAASGGSLALKWDGNKPKGKKWGFSDVSSDDEKQFLADLAESSGALAKLNSAWNDVPAKYARENSKDAGEKLLASFWKKAKDRESKKQIYKAELEKFKELKEKLPGTVIADYYEKKKTYYVNVGTNGFYIFGKKDPNKINENCRKKKLDLVPSFSDSADVSYRVRVQDKGGGNFQYTFELSFSIKKTNNSPYNIGPILGGGNVAIIENKLNIDCFS
jgi:hypothetical protein